MTLIDIGVNLTNKRFRNDRDDVVERAKNADVQVLIATGTSEKASLDAAALHERYSNVFSTAGVHPHDAKHYTPDTQKVLEGLLDNQHVVAVGECGLDYNRDFSPRPVQVEVLEAQLELAAKVQKPVFLHERDAHEAFIEILARYRDRICDAVVHCFTGTLEEAKAYLDLDMHIGVTGWVCDERRGDALRRAVPLIPLDRLMVETDAPYLTPRDMKPKPKGGRNEPAFLPHVTKAVASLLEKPYEEVAEATTRTAQRFFRLPKA